MKLRFVALRELRHLLAEDPQRPIDRPPVGAEAQRRPAVGTVTREGLKLGFAAVDAREIRRGVLDLAVALESCLP